MTVTFLDISYVVYYGGAFSPVFFANPTGRSGSNFYFPSESSLRVDSVSHLFRYRLRWKDLSGSLVMCVNYLLCCGQSLLKNLKFQSHTRFKSYDLRMNSHVLYRDTDSCWCLVPTRFSPKLPQKGPIVKRPICYTASSSSHST